MSTHQFPPHGWNSKRPCKRQAVGPTTKGSTVRIINQNAITSPLLRIPAEVRELIWRAAMGDRTFHIKHLDQDQLKTLQRHQTHPDSTRAEGAFRYIQCTAILSEDEAYKASKLPSQSVPGGEDPTCYVQSCKSRHSSCYSLGDGTFGKQVWVRLFEQVDYSVAERDRVTICSLLGASRQIYQEGYRLFWMTNTFSFDDVHSLGEFLGSLTLSQKRHLTKLHVVRRWCQLTQLWFWHTRHYERTRNDLGLLQGLKTLHLCIEQRTHSGNFDLQYRRMARRDERLINDMCQPWSALRTSPLANVTVIISDKRAHLQQNNLLMNRCTVAEKNWAAEKIRDCLINDPLHQTTRQPYPWESSAGYQRSDPLHQTTKQPYPWESSGEYQRCDPLHQTTRQPYPWENSDEYQRSGPLHQNTRQKYPWETSDEYQRNDPLRQTPLHQTPLHQTTRQKYPWEIPDDYQRKDPLHQTPLHQTTRQKYPWESPDGYQRNHINDSFNRRMAGTSAQQQEQEPQDTLPPQHSAYASEASYHVSDQAQQQDLARQPVDDTYQPYSLRNNHTQQRNPLGFPYPAARRTDALVPSFARPVNVDQSLAQEHQVLSRHQGARRHIVEDRAHERFSPYSRPARQQQVPRAAEEKEMDDALLRIEEDKSSDEIQAVNAEYGS